MKNPSELKITDIRFADIDGAPGLHRAVGQGVGQRPPLELSAKEE